MSWNIIISLFFGALGGGITGAISTYILAKRYFSRLRIEIERISKTTYSGREFNWDNIDTDKDTTNISDLSKEEIEKGLEEGKIFGEYEEIESYFLDFTRKGAGILNEVVINRIFDTTIVDQETGIILSSDIERITDPKYSYSIILFVIGKKNGEEYLLVPKWGEIPEYPEYDDLPKVHGRAGFKVGLFEENKEIEIKIDISGEGAEGATLDKTIEELRNESIGTKTKLSLR